MQVPRNFRSLGRIPRLIISITYPFAFSRIVSGIVSPLQRALVSSTCSGTFHCRGSRRSPEHTRAVSRGASASIPEHARDPRRTARFSETGRRSGTCRPAPVEARAILQESSRTASKSRRSSRRSFGELAAKGVSVRCRLSYRFLVDSGKSEIIFDESNYF